MSATRIISRLAPWIVPVPTAWFVFAGMVANMHTPAWVAIVAAVAIELIGLSAVSLGLELRTYNARRRAKDPAAPVRIAYGIMGGYIVTVIILSILLDAAITLATIARAVFPLLSLAAFGILALEDDHAARVATIKADKEQARQERQEAKAARQVALHTEEVAGKMPNPPRHDWRNLPVEDKVLVKSMSPAEVAAAYCVKERTAREWVARARKNGFEVK